MEETLYFESHITIDPPDSPSAVQDLATPFGFRLAKLYMAKDVPSTIDGFLTARNRKKDQMVSQTRGMVRALQEAGYGVRRYKIEAAIMDSKIDDELSLGICPRLTPGKTPEMIGDLAT